MTPDGPSVDPPPPCGAAGAAGAAAREPDHDAVAAGAVVATDATATDTGATDTATTATDATGAADADVRAAVGRVLDRVLDDRVERARTVDRLFAEDIAQRVARFTRHGGRRLRSQLLWWAMRACAGRRPVPVAAALRMGAALELLQTCALVQDDVMDRSERRRGHLALHADVSAQYAHAARPRLVRRFGDASAILASDLALTWADDLVAETEMEPDVARAVRRLWGDMRAEMVAGQYLDVQGQVTASRSLPRALRSACLKSALYSVERPLALGAALAGADEGTRDALCVAGRHIGMAFQLRDDLDDVYAGARPGGRDAGGDIREGKPTCLVALARARADASGDRTALEVLDRSLGDAALTDEGLEEVREVLARTGARALVEERIGRMTAQGLARFDTAALDAEGGSRLRDLLVAIAGGPPPDPQPPRREPAPPHGGSASARPPATPAHREDHPPPATPAHPEGNRLPAAPAPTEDHP
ncbi:polyprenyl synthetase family protein [Streptomyces sp. NPDC005573]|uniref:polyprenyl synthetase family protein n=1 Tax=Streptomyces sp. NPDC005573 TaxID=3156890 RepID=UPI0033BDF68E